MSTVLKLGTLVSALLLHGCGDGDAADDQNEHSKDIEVLNAKIAVEKEQQAKIEDAMNANKEKFEKDIAMDKQRKQEERDLKRFDDKDIPEDGKFEEQVGVEEEKRLQGMTPEEREKYRQMAPKLQKIKSFKGVEINSDDDLSAMKHSDEKLDTSWNAVQNLDLTVFDLASDKLENREYIDESVDQSILSKMSDYQKRTKSSESGYLSLFRAIYVSTLRTYGDKKQAASYTFKNIAVYDDYLDGLPKWPKDVDQVTFFSNMWQHSSEGDIKTFFKTYRQLMRDQRDELATKYIDMWQLNYQWQRVNAMVSLVHEVLDQKSVDYNISDKQMKIYNTLYLSEMQISEKYDHASDVFYDEYRGIYGEQEAELPGGWKVTGAGDEEEAELKKLEKKKEKMSQKQLAAFEQREEIARHRQIKDEERKERNRKRALQFAPKK